ncbi:hypothetical protein [Streptomyces sp. ADI93-02]|uniref:hypothetical protein n=1 Tax=Streptomyces sp. ADI93-02 TaxID=1522757 RepID=UPI0019D0DD57|nr:hypothetical protein [Streptomyces sp. ADI93-02]
MDARTRERLPVLPMRVRTVGQRRKDAAALLEAARHAAPGEVFTAAGQQLERAVVPHGTAGRVWAENPSTGKRRDLGLEEERAFWTRAVVEVLRATGIRIEEPLALSHHSLVQYRLPTTGELVPLLQIVPSKTDTERLLLVSPELADVLSAIICRAREATGAVPLVRSYDRRECAWQELAPLLFQRRIRGEDCALSRRGNPGAHGLPRPPPVPPPERGIPRSHRRGMARVPRPLRAAQSLHRSMRPRVRHPLHSRTCLRPLPDAVARPRPA